MSGGGKYRLDARLGGGGMAEVFVAATVGAEGFSRKVAIKKVLPGFSDNPQFAQMFVAEAQISSRLVHPNIVSVTDFDRDAENRLFLVMELVEGKDLDGLLQTGLLPFPVVIYIVTEALRGLGHAHDLPVSSDLRGIVHRDVSPHNVLLSWEGAVKVSDFGIAKAKAASEATASVMIKGKPAYMSPEQANGRPLDGRSDLFAVGVMLWEMLVGQRLFVAEDTRATLAAVLFGQIQRPRAMRSDVPKDLERVTMKLLERDLEARYPTADDAVADLLNCAAAPKNGRDDLRRVLAERYPHQMPVRQSVMRSQSGQTPTPVGTGNQHHAAAAMAPTFGGDGSMPSVSAKMKAETGTIMPGDRPAGRKTIKIALVIGVTVVTAVLTFAVVTGLKKKNAAVDAGAVAMGSADAGGSVGSSTSTTPGSGATTDGSNGTGGSAGAPNDAGGSNGTGGSNGGSNGTTGGSNGGSNGTGSNAGGSATVDAGSGGGSAKHSTPAAKKYGSLRVTGFPVVKVFVDGAYKGETPTLTVNKVTVGQHKVRLLNDSDNPHDETQTVDVAEGKVTPVKKSN